MVSPAIPEALARSVQRPLPLIYNKYFVDEFYDATVVEPVVDGSRTLLWRMADVGVIDGTVNGIGKTARAIGSILRPRNPATSAVTRRGWWPGPSWSSSLIGPDGRLAMTLLDVVLFLPLIGFLLLLLVPKDNPRPRAWAR